MGIKDDLLDNDSLDYDSFDESRLNSEHAMASATIVDWGKVAKPTVVRDKVAKLTIIDWDKVAKLLRCVLLPAKSGVPVDRLNREY